MPAGVEVLPWATTAWAAALDSRQSASAFFTHSFCAAVRRGAFAGAECLEDAGLSFGFAFSSFTAGGGVGAGGSGSQAPIAFPPYMIAPAKSATRAAT